MVKKKRKEDRGHYRLVRSQDHRSHYVIGSIPQVTEDDIRLHLYNEVVEGSDGDYYISTAQIILPRTGAKRLWETIGKALRSEATQKTESAILPKKIEKVVDKGEKERKTKGKKKVQKIRLK